MRPLIKGEHDSLTLYFVDNLSVHFSLPNFSVVGENLAGMEWAIPRPNAFGIFFHTPKDFKHILVILVRPLTRLKHKIQNLPLSLPGRAHAILLYKFILPP